MSTTDLKKEADRVNKIGDQYIKQKKYKEAVDVYQQSVELARQAGDNRKAENFEKELEEAIAKCAQEYNNQGDSLFKQKQYKAAMEIYQKAYDMLVSAGEKWVKKNGKEFLSELNKTKVKYAQEILIKQAEDLVKQNKIEESIKKYGEAIELITPEVDGSAHNSIMKASRKIIEARAQEINNQGDKLYKEKKFNEAIPLYAESVRLINMTDNEGKKKDFTKELVKSITENSQSINNAGDQLMKEGKYMKAAEMYKQSVEGAKQTGNQKLIDNFTSEMNKAYQKFAEQINAKGDALFKEKKFEEAAQVYANSVAIAKESNNPKLADNFTKEMQKANLEAAKSWNAKGDDNFKASKFKDAFECQEKAVHFAELADDKGKLKEIKKKRDSAMEKQQ